MQTPKALNANTKLSFKKNKDDNSNIVPKINTIKSVHHLILKLNYYSYLKFTNNVFEFQ